MALPDDAPVTDIRGIGPKRGEKLAVAGYKTVGDIRTTSPDALALISDIGEWYAWKLREVAGLEEEAEYTPETIADQQDEQDRPYYEHGDSADDAYWDL